MIQGNGLSLQSPQKVRERVFRRRWAKGSGQIQQGCREATPNGDHGYAERVRDAL